MVLAAGAGRRLAPYTDTLPKTLVPVDGDRTILDIALANLKAAGLDDVAVVTGYAAGAVEERKAALEERHGVRARAGLQRPQAEEWNNAYSLWCARAPVRRRACCSSTATRSTRRASRTTLLGSRGPGHPARARRRQAARRGGDEGARHARGPHDAHQQGARPRHRAGRVHRADADRAGGGGRAGRRAARRRSSAIPQLYYEDGFQEYADRGGHVGVAPIGAVDWAEVDDHARPRARAGDRLPLLTRMIGAPLSRRHRPRHRRPARPAARRPADLRGRPRRRGRRARAGRGDRRDAAPRARERRLLDARRRRRRRGATRSPSACAPGFYDALVGIGGGRTLDVSKLASTLSGPADGRGGDQPRPRRHRLAGRVAGGGRAARAPTACRCRSRWSSTSTTCAGREPGDAALGDRRRDLQPVARSPTGGSPSASAASRSTALAVTFAQTAAKAILHRTDGIDDDDFLVALAEALVLSGLAMATAGLEPARAAAATTRSCTRSTTSSPARRATASWPARATLFTSYLRGDAAMAAAVDACLHAPRAAAAAGRPRADRGAVRRGGRCTRRARGPTASRSSSTSALDAQGGERACPRVRRRLRSLSCAPRRSPPSIFARNSGEHWAGRLYVRRLSPYVTRALLPTRVTPNAVTWAMLVVGLLAAAVLTLPGCARGRSRPRC